MFLFFLLFFFKKNLIKLIKYPPFPHPHNTGGERARASLQLIIFFWSSLNSSVLGWDLGFSSLKIGNCFFFSANILYDPLNALNVTFDCVGPKRKYPSRQVLLSHVKKISILNVEILWMIKTIFESSPTYDGSPLLFLTNPVS